MGISPPGDIVLDVAQAADPSRFQAATKRLSEMTGPSSGVEFAEVLKGSGARLSGPAGLDPYAVRIANRNRTELSSGDRAGSAHKQFEAFILQNFIESMMPKEAGSVFGSGTAGSVWRSMLAEQIGNQIAQAGGIGIADKIFSPSKSRQAHTADVAAPRSVTADPLKIRS